jgi:aminopeptidase N
LDLSTNYFQFKLKDTNYKSSQKREIGNIKFVDWSQISGQIRFSIYIYGMKKISLFFLLTCLSLNLLAQEDGTCAEGKLKSYQRVQKKTRAGAYANSLLDKYDVHFYFLDINAERNTTVLSGATTIGAKVTAASIDTFCFELNSSLTIDSVIYNNQVINVARVGSIAYALLPSPALQNANVSIKIYYNGDANVVGGSAIGDGYSTGTSQSWGNQVTWSLSEPYSAYEWFPCKQFLQDKADSAWVYVTTSNQNKVGSNGLLQGIDSLPNNKVRYRWKTNYTIDYYLISVAISKYVEYKTYAHPTALPNDSIPIVNYVYDNPNTLPAFQSHLDSVTLMVEHFSELFGLYPFHEEKYGNAMAPFSGAMEHQTMTSVGNLGSLSLNAHELVHHWFGDLVTCKTWKDIFVNEGLTSYGEYLAFEHFRGWNSAQSRMLGVHDNVLQDPNAMVYFTDTTDVGRIFSKRLTYDKGGAVTHTLRFILGDSLFFAGLKNYLNQFAFSTASIDDLKASLEAFTGQNLSDYFNQWLYGEGYPTFSGEYFSNGTNLFLKITHTTSSTATPLFKTPLEIKCSSPSGDTTIKIDITQNTNTFVIPTAKDITNISFDPVNWLLNESGTVTKNPNLISLAVIDHDLESSIELFPNPATDVVRIVSKLDAQAQYTLKDIQGKLVQQGQVGLVDVSAIQTGVYILDIQTKNGKVSRKFVKQ